MIETFHGDDPSSPPGDVGPPGALGQDGDVEVLAPQERGDGATEAGVPQNEEVLGLLGERAPRRGAQQLGVTAQGLRAAAGLGGGFGQEWPVEVLGQRPGQGANARVGGVTGDDDPSPLR